MYAKRYSPVFRVFVGVGGLSFTYPYRWVLVRAMRAETVEHKKLNAPLETGFLTFKVSGIQSLCC